MIGLSVAVGRFVEALLWGMLRVGGVVAVAALSGLVAIAILVLLARRIWRRR